MIAPLHGQAGVVGTLTVANRLGDVRTFTDADGRLFSTVVTQVSATLENGRLLDRLTHDSLHDALTGLANRTKFQQQSRELLATSFGAPVAVLLMDLDRFKEINDTLGHHVGDLLLQEMGRRLRGLLRGDAIVARLGGDEFAVLLPGGTAAV